MAEKLADIPVLARAAVENEKIFELVLSYFEGSSRKNRQHAASVFKLISEDHPEILVPLIPSFLDALDRPEAQTRWCSLEVLERLIAFDSEQCLQAMDGAETALFDDKHGFLREKAFCFLCTVGTLSHDLANKVWPLLDEAIQCYHGDPEFMAMMGGLLFFAEADIPENVKQALKERLAFDAKNTKGAIGKRAQHIVSVLE